MIENIVLSLLVIVVITQCVVIYFLAKLYSRGNRRDSVIIHKVMETEKNLLTLGKVVKIFEDETQILKKRNEQAAVKDRFRNAR